MEKILRVNLSNEKISSQDVAKEALEKYIGGMGVATSIFTREVPPSVLPFDEKNLLIFSVGPFCGTIVPFCGRYFVTAKSPLTNILGEASSGGFWGKELKSTGFSHIIISGKSKSPVYLWIKDDKAEIRDASKQWGKGNNETTELIESELGDDKIKVASIGPAGENLVKFASIMNEERAAGRCGLGAVMGSKKLKAIAVRGTGKLEVKNKEVLSVAVKKLNEFLKNNPLVEVHRDYGTPLGMDNMPHIGDVPIKNFTMSRWLGTKKIGAYALMEKEVRVHACFNCPVGCSRQVKHEGKWVRWPEYETVAMMGSNLMVNDLDAIIKWNTMANDFGLDTISLGSTIAMFIEAIERGKLDTKREKIKIFPKWGLTSEIEKLVKIIAYREGIGNDLAEGVKSFCENKGLPEDLATHGKGLEVPAHEPRANNLTALDYATAPRGAFHCYMPMDVSSGMYVKKEIGIIEIVDRFAKDERVAETVKKVQDASEAYSACGGCVFGFKWIPEITPWIDALNAIVGSSYNVKTWMGVGERIFNLKRSYNISCGITKADDKIGSRFSTSIEKGATFGNVPPINELLPIYYELRGWDEDGRPRPNQL